MNRSHPLSLLALACASVLALAADPDWPAVAGTYPALGTPESRMELETMHRLQDTRTPADVARAGRESHTDLACFLDALGSSRDPEGFPATTAMLEQAKGDLKPIVAELKRRFDRPRPYVADPTLVPAFHGDGKPSFPSRHSAVGALFASLLSRLDPADREALEREGRLIGDDRVMAGLHWPSDDLAGQRLGRAFADHWLTLPGNARMLLDAAGEWTGL